MRVMRSSQTQRADYGKGNRSEGRLNPLDLMVYAVAKERNMALLCTRRDFASADVELRPESRT